MRTLRTSVRGLVEFLLRSGDIDAQNDWRGGVELMQAGSNIHRMLQAAGGDAYQAEVSLACSVFFPGNSFNPHAARLEISEEAVADQEGFFLRVEGRADGIIDNGTHAITIDEIKGTTRDVAAITEPIAVHEAQALCYAYLYLRSKRGASALSSAFVEHITVRLTYASMNTGEVRQLERTHSVPDIEAWFFSLLVKAQRWYAWRVRHNDLREKTLAALAFPFMPRSGQQKIMDAVASAIHEGRRLYVQAPTGSGKTIATLYPALKAMAAGEGAHIAFLTAKSTTRGPVLECLEMLRKQNVSVNVLVMTARDKICPLRAGARDAAVRTRPLSSLCNPIECPLARGHYDAVNDALFEAITSHDVLDAARIEEIAARHHVCPYELQRDAARWSDIIVCDYHYAFAPSAGLAGLTDEADKGALIYLVDEAHNLVERMREMYSAELFMADLKELERLLRANGSYDELATLVRTAISAFPAWDKNLPAGMRPGTKRGGGRPLYQVVGTSDAFAESLTTLENGIDTALEQLFSLAQGLHGDKGQPGALGTGTVEVFLALHDTGLRIGAFLAALQRAEAGYVTFLSKANDGTRKLKVYCMDPSHDLAERLEHATAAVFFSGTLLPMDYHRKLLAAKDDDESIYASSSFDPRHLNVLIGTDVSTRYSKRGPALYARCASYLVAVAHARPGNYLAFLPSYAMLEEVAKALDPLTNGRTEIVRQHPNMRESEREQFIAQFRKKRNAGTSLIGLCVLGGVFGESIDLPGDALVGVIIMGTGMPRASAEREVIRDYFDAKKGKGFAYAYTYPGMIKVLQAAGRLIRTEKDHGVIVLLDDRFLEHELQKAFPQEWKNVRTCTLDTVPKLLAPLV